MGTDGHWLLTGCAGFIGSHLLERVLGSGRTVVGVDDLSNGSQANLEAVRRGVGAEAWSRFKFLKQDIRDAEAIEAATQGASVILHNAALGSVPRSLVEPKLFHAVNIDGTLNLLESARRNNVGRFVFASSSSVYGDEPVLPKVESKIGEPLSPYAVTKRVNEIQAAVYFRSFGIQTVGLRYFNVFGPRQNPNGAYAAVIPRWISALSHDEDLEIFGDGTNSRDFCFVENVVEANMAAATTNDEGAFGRVFNIACGERTDLNQLADMLKNGIEGRGRPVRSKVFHRAPRPGDVAHSHADISRACKVLDYSARISVAEGLDRTLHYYLVTEPSGKSSK